MNSEDYKIAYENVMIANKMLEQEIERLHSIIKEVREYINYYGITPEQNDIPIVRSILKGILKILDKENN